jgi:hypothetical protein
MSLDVRCDFLLELLIVKRFAPPLVFSHAPSKSSNAGKQLQYQRTIAGRHGSRNWQLVEDGERSYRARFDIDNLTYSLAYP